MGQHANAPALAAPSIGGGRGHAGTTTTKAVPVSAHTVASASVAGSPAGGEHQSPGALTPRQIHSFASQATSGTNSELPFLSQIQNSFGPDHPVGHIKAYTDGVAKHGTKAMGANAMARGHSVAFGRTPSLFTTAHEATHVLQQQHGVTVPRNVGSAGDPYERMADAVATRVVSGQGASDLLNQLGPRPRANARAPVQQRPAITANPTHQEVEIDA